jgi:lipopolysaccharide transport system permease protein
VTSYVFAERSPNVAPVARDLIIQPRPGWIAIDWRELWEPLFTMLIFTVIFGRLAKIPSEGLPYAIFVFAGLLPWTYFANAVSQASQSLVSQQALLTKIYLPRLFVPGAAVGGGLIDLGVSALVFAGIMLYYSVLPGWGFLAIPLLVVLTTAAALGVGLSLAALTVTYRDFRYVVPFMIQSWMYISPVIYPVSAVPPQWQWALALNPMAGIIDAFRSALLGLPWNFTTLAVSSVSSVVVLVFGLFYFRKTERRFADVA